MLALIDGDIVLYRIGFTTENESEDIARLRTDDLLDSILEETGAKEYEIWLSDSRDNNYRFSLSPTYHANRKAPRPKHYEIIKEFLVKEWGARFAYGMEADDALGIAQDKKNTFGLPHVKREGDVDLYNMGFNPHDTVICSIDKDLLQIPGLHYNFVKKEWQEVTSWEGLQWFYKQILIGDTSDNVQGCSGVGPVKAGKAIDKIRPEAGEAALFEAVVQTYQKYEKQKTQQEILDHILLAGRLLKIKQTEDEEIWRFPKSPLTVVEASSSTPCKAEAIILSTEPTTPVTMKSVGS